MDQEISTLLLLSETSPLSSKMAAKCTKSADFSSKLDHSWLAMNLDKWVQEESFRLAESFVKTVKVTNDVAERGVKLDEDYAIMLTKDDDIRALIYQKKVLNG